MVPGQQGDAPFQGGQVSLLLFITQDLGSRRVIRVGFKEIFLA